MRPTAPRPPRPAGSPSSSISSGSSGSFHRERERSPRTPLPLLAPLLALGPVYPVPRTPMTDARRYRSLFSRRRVAPPTPPYPSPPPSDEEPSEGMVDPTAELEGDLTSLTMRILCTLLATKPIILIPPTVLRGRVLMRMHLGLLAELGLELLGEEVESRFWALNQSVSSVSVSSAPYSRHSSDDSFASGSVGYGEASSGSASDCASDDDLVNRHFAGTFP
ncbi:hypothetical protein PIB30_011758 [Stylosanthes scabra]|uniref:Uncharacterized protein n=1 Tax=Stylosanthes scabra TaxID=79078 RepID=A0ABU6Q6W2_9FABA|nr:hypothetical protein [Stylosanthes scabra]